MKTKPISPELAAELAALAALPDDTIDLSDIPETTAEQWAKGQRWTDFVAERRKAVRRVA